MWKRNNRPYKRVILKGEKKMKTYVLDVRYYIQADDEDELNEILDNMGVRSNEYYGGYDIVDVEEDEE